MKITDTAKEQIKKNAKFLKITVELGGCSGFQYDLSYQNISDDLLIIEDLIITDEVSLKLIKDITLDFKDEIGYQEFTIKNPVTQGSCGCGNSFRL